VLGALPLSYTGINPAAGFELEASARRLSRAPKSRAKPRDLDAWISNSLCTCDHPLTRRSNRSLHHRPSIPQLGLKCPSHTGSKIYGSGNKRTRQGFRPWGFEPRSPKAVQPKKYPWPNTT